ncbi:hypothetical protein [Aquimarina litoralis]
MKKRIYAISEVKTLSKSSQKQISGGMSGSADYFSKCFPLYLSDIDGTMCAIFSPSGEICYGTIRYDECCI